MQSTSTSDRAFVLGLDGVPWEMLREWAADGSLPNFNRLFGEGAAGPLRSTRPASTPLAWPSIATGVWPDKHGVYGFQRLTADHRREMYTGDDVSRPSLWEMLTPAVVGNVPMTYPATELDGTMVTGMLTPELNDRFTYPPSLRETIVEEIPDYTVGLFYEQYHDRKGEFLDALDAVVEKRRRLLSLLMREEEWRLFFFVFTAPDRLQHLIWEKSQLRAHYRLLDTILGDVMRYVEEHGATLYVVSDHGFGPIEKHASANTLLEEHGFLVRKSAATGGARSVLGRVGLTKARFERVLGRFDLDLDAVAKRLPRSVVDSVAEHVPGNHALYDVNFSQTAAFVHGEGLVYVNDVERFENGAVDPDRIPALKKRLTRLFEEYTDPETGDQVFEVVDGSEAYPTDERAPDLVVEPTPGYEIKGALTDRVCVPSAVLEASHRPDGIFLAWGPDVAAGVEVEGATVVDVAPTLLHAAGEPIPEDADGRVLTEMFDPNSALASAEIRSTAYRQSAGDDSTEDDFNGVEDRLRGLGYME
ncbi:alkaline phosphatase family protein [Halegenticoccus tardaugens]|uniref:alkaline phosphatase family protein n=1 Tax=Halegenticoccus tardaugens TaxID=2071624 RepID=UPI00100B6F46|nr:alkaline phosphatase family protein [Halegenticoccus tardaugens]